MGLVLPVRLPSAGRGKSWGGRCNLGAFAETGSTAKVPGRRGGKGDACLTFAVGGYHRVMARDNFRHEMSSRKSTFCVGRR